MTIGNRLKELRIEKNYKKSDIASALKLPYTTYNNYETDTNDVNSEMLRVFAAYYGVTTDYLLGIDKTDMHNANSEALRDNETLLIDLFRDLNDEGQEIAINMLKGLINSGEYKKFSSIELVEEA
ncbi:MAG: helix-turn-helix domain-containing protein [Clostridiales Family XIII bacterium]|jgi:transcriptional regulator with XRE-family HTH domain|nr:helix-turn-helix domain-containing protein [Clostridiales Family XIII bacterium]